MALLDSNSPKRLTLRAGLAQKVGGLSLPSPGLFYWLGEFFISGQGTDNGLGIVSYPTLPRSAGADGFVETRKLIQTTDYELFIEPNSERDFLWIANDTLLRRHPLDGDGMLLDSDAAILLSSVEGEVFALDIDTDGLVLYGRDGTDRTVKAWSLSSGTSPKRLAAKDFMLGSGARGWDVKTVNGVRHVAYVLSREVYYDGSRVYEHPDPGGDISDFGNIDLNEGAGGSLFLILSTLRGRFKDMYVGTIDVSGREIYQMKEIVRGVSTEAPTVTAFSQFKRDAIIGARVLETGCMGFMVSYSVERLTEAAGASGFREVRRGAADIAITQIKDELFMLNQDWYFEYDGLTYQMVEFNWQGDELIASCEVS